jgi:capsular exopolysaccharide synthesis family protein
MSNIFDALRKSREVAEPRVVRSGVAIEPEAESGFVEAPEIDFQLNQELEGLRERLELELPRTGRRVFMLASSVEGEGASTVALHLARIMARSPTEKVLLVDGDLSDTPESLSALAGGEIPRPGLVELLDGRLDLHRAILATAEPNLHFLPAGAEPVRPLDLFASERMRHFVEDTGELYRHVLIDCPPVLDHTEVPVLGALTEGVVLVIRAHRTRREIVQRSLSVLKASRCRVLGVVLNQRRYPIPEFLYRRL